MILCAVGGVQSQSFTVDRQMKRYHVPRLAFINKMDRTGADAERVCQEIRDKLGDDAILMQYPIGAGDTFVGLIDLVSFEALYFDGEHGERVRRAEVPADLREPALAARVRMLEALAMYSDEMMELLLSEEQVPVELIHDITRQVVQQQDVTPVYLGSAYRNKGVQPLLDAITRYLPSPLARSMTARSTQDPQQTVPLSPDPDAPLVGMAFKIVDDPYGQLTFLRLYQGRIDKGQMYYNQRTGKRDRFSRIVRMHADKREEIDSAVAGDIVAVMGIDGASGDTYSTQPGYCSLESMFVPEPVIQVAISPALRADADRLGKALARFRKEDPTFRVTTDQETNEILIAGMGELHLEIYVERIRREYKVQVEVGAPKVSYRESPTQSVAFNYKHRKQTGGSGQYAHIVGRMEPLGDDREADFVFEECVVGGRIPKQYIPSI